MVKNQKRSGWKDNRALILIVLFISMVSLVLAMANWLDIRPQDLVLGLTFADMDENPNATTVYISEEHNSLWNSRYESDTKEFIYCLYGKPYEEGYLIEEIGETDVLDAADDIIEYVPCRVNQRFLGTLHSHPPSQSAGYFPTCKLSVQDGYTFGTQETPLTGVICGKERYGFYANNNFDESFKIVIVEV